MRPARDFLFIQLLNTRDENGNLISDYTFDQIHLKAKYYQLWKDYLFAHGIVRD